MLVKWVPTSVNSGWFAEQSVSQRKKKTIKHGLKWYLIFQMKQKYEDGNVFKYQIGQKWKYYNLAN